MQLAVGPGLENDSPDDSPMSRYCITLFSRKPASTVLASGAFRLFSLKFEVSCCLFPFDMVDTVGIWRSIGPPGCYFS